MSGRRISRRRVDGVLRHGTSITLRPRFRFDPVAFCIGKFDDELVRLDLDPDDMVVDEDCVVDCSVGLVEMTLERL